MVIEESPPRLGRRLPTADQVFAHARFADIDAELQQLAVDTRRTPTRVFLAHASDEVANVAGDRRAPGLASPDLPRPEKGKTPCGARQ